MHLVWWILTRPSWWGNGFRELPSDSGTIRGLAADSKQMFVLPIQMNSGSPEFLNIFPVYREKKPHSKHVTIGNEEQIHKNSWLFGTSLDLLNTKLVLCGGETLPCFCEGDKAWESRTTSTLTHNVLKKHNVGKLYTKHRVLGNGRVWQ